jgi:opacity protein-like surface antigen
MRKTRSAPNEAGCSAQGATMKRLALAAAIAQALVSPAAHAEPATSFYGRDGSYAGSAFTYGNQKTFTNNRGEFSGTSITHGGTTNFYDNAGRFQGSTMQQGTASNPLTGTRR